MKLDTLQKLYTEELRDLYNAENQLLKALPKMAKAASSEELKDAFEKHLEQTKAHVERLEQVFEELGENPKGKTCRAMKGLIQEGSEILEQDGDESVRDAGIIVAAQKVEHYEIAGYGSARTFAHLLGQNKAAELLQTTLDEESETNELLTRLAESIINPEAVRDSELVGASSDRRRNRHRLRAHDRPCLAPCRRGQMRPRRGGRRRRSHLRGGAARRRRGADDAPRSHERL